MRKRESFGLVFWGGEIFLERRTREKKKLRGRARGKKVFVERERRKQAGEGNQSVGMKKR